MNATWWTSSPQLCLKLGTMITWAIKISFLWSHGESRSWLEWMTCELHFQTSCVCMALFLKLSDSNLINSISTPVPGTWHDDYLWYKDLICLFSREIIRLVWMDDMWTPFSNFMCMFLKLNDSKLINSISTPVPGTWHDDYLWYKELSSLFSREIIRLVWMDEMWTPFSNFMCMYGPVFETQW